jgi:hypothetical protein
MWMRKLAVGLALPALATLGGCKCCHTSERPCCSPAIIRSAPAPGCPNCGPGPGPGGIITPPPPSVVTPPPGGAPGSFYPPSGPFSPSGAKI